MDHHEQHHQHHEKEREREKERRKEHEQKEEKRARYPHPLWFAVVGAVLTILAVFVWIRFF
jgi:hypothetical protein